MILLYYKIGNKKPTFLGAGFVVKSSTLIEMARY